MSNTLALRAVVAVGLASLWGTAAVGAPLRVAGDPIEVVVSEVEGGRTVRVEIVPLDAEGKAKSAPESTVLVQFPVVEKLRLREIDGEREVQVGRSKVV